MKDLFKIALARAKRVYRVYYDLGTVEFDLVTFPTKNFGKIQILSIAGSNEILDWWKNIILFSWKGIKWASYQAARKIFKSKQFQQRRKLHLPLLIVGHSKSGGTAPAFMSLYGGAWCVAFNPCPSVRKWKKKKKLEDTYLFMNAVDPVSIAGTINFDHWDCKTYLNLDDKGNIADNHRLDQWDEFIDNMDFKEE